jgi:tetratricopeptide (TPR) repeat protein
MEIDAIRALREDDVRSALQILAACFGIAKDTFGSDSVRAARAAASYGFVLLHSKQFQKSQSMLNDAVVVLQRDLGGENKEVLVCKSAWARALVGIGDLKHAEEIIIDCLDACERSLGLNDNFSVKILRQLGQLYSSTDVKLHTARELFQECFSHACAQLQCSMVNASPESTNSEYFEVLDDLVGVFVKLNDLESAQVVLQEANETLLKLYGRSHWSTLKAASRWANVLVLMGSPQKALPLFEHVLYVRSTTLGSASHATVCAAEDLAHAYEMLSQFDDAEMLLRLSVIQRRAARQFSPSEFVSSLLRLALIMQKGGKFECAVLCFLECLEERSRQPYSLEERSRQPHSRDCVEIIAAENAGFCFMKMGLGQRARIMLSYCVQLLRMPNVLTEAAVKQHMRVCLSNLGVVSASEGNLSEAEINFQACVLLNSSEQTAEDAVHIDFADAAWNLAVVYHKSGKVSQSESFFVKCIQAYEQSQDFAKASDAKYSLALLYRWVFALCERSMLSQAHFCRDMGQVKKAEEALLQVTRLCCLVQANL